MGKARHRGINLPRSRAGACRLCERGRGRRRRPCIRVVGGNQGFRGGPTRIQGGIVRSSDVAQAISYRRIGAQFADRVLHSVRTKGFLR